MSNVNKKDAIVALFVVQLRSAESLNFEALKSEIRAEVGTRYTTQDINLALHDARERVREQDGIEFISRSECPGLFFRANERQKMGRAASVRRKAFRAKERAVTILDAVDESKLTGEQLELLRRRKDRYGLDLIRGTQLNQLQRVLPKQSDFPDVPRGDRRR
jgi:hypothetical protein